MFMTDFAMFEIFSSLKNFAPILGGMEQNEEINQYKSY